MICMNLLSFHGLIFAILKNFLNNSLKQLYRNQLQAAVIKTF